MGQEPDRARWKGLLRGRSALGLATKIRIIIASLVGLTVISLTTDMYYSQHDAIERAALSRARSLTFALAGYAADYLRRDRIDEARMMAKDLMREADVVEAVVVDAFGFIIADGESDSDRLFDDIDDDLVDRAIESQAVEIEFRNGVLAAAAPSLVEFDSVGAVRVTFALSPMRAELADALTRAALVGLVALGTALLVSHLIVSHFRKPLDKLIAGTRQAAAGCLDHRIDVQTNDELEELSHAFNSMLERLETSIRDTEHLAFTDQLTGLPNRTAAKQLLDQELRRQAQRNGLLALMFLDVDKFKLVNDTFGHEAGDQLLIHFAKTVSSVLRGDPVSKNPSEWPIGSATVARLGGDEFTIILPGIEAADDASLIAERIATCLSTPFYIGERELRVETSIGIALAPRDGSTSELLLQKADMAMYAAKAGGRGRYVFYEVSMQEETANRLWMEHELRRAVENAELKLFVQPQLDLATGAVNGVEMLVRWTHPRIGDISPMTFIPVAEETGLINQIGAWVMKEACHWSRFWRQSGIGDFRIGVNVAAHEFDQATFVANVIAILNETGMPPELLELELTESTMLVNLRDTVAKLSQLRAKGIKVAIDDFGTGYSSLGQLKHLPLDRIKIDRSFVKDIPEDSDDMAITEAILALGQSLGYEMIAEGVETGEQLQFLRERGCQEMQGFLVARPMPVECLGEWLCEHFTRQFDNDPQQAIVSA